jgi:hypothetical protein
VAIQWRRLAELAFSRATQTEQSGEKALLLDIAARYRELKVRPQHAARAAQIKNKGDAPGAGMRASPCKPSLCG